METYELLMIIKYELYTRNKAALALMWDFNVEIMRLPSKIKNIRLRERYGEGEVPYEAKTVWVRYCLLYRSPMLEI
jgi:hypothetical protein